MTKQTKLNVLIKLAHLFEMNKVTWQLGGSAMLFLRGYIEDFHDLDMMIPMSDAMKVDHLMSSIAHSMKEITHETDQSAFFRSYEIDGVHVDVMANLSFISEGVVYHFPLEEKKSCDYTFLKNQKIYISDVSKWLTYYRLMKRYDRVKLIEDKLNMMQTFDIILKTPSQEDIPQIASFRKAFIDKDESLHGGCGLSSYDDIEAWLSYLKLFLTKETLPLNRVVSSSFICLRKSDLKMVGILHLRHELDEALLLHGGHIGYSIHPDERGKKYAHEQLRLGLLECDVLGINPVLITCNLDNEASRRTIIHAGGIKENEYAEEDGNLVERYWIHRT